MDIADKEPLRIFLTGNRQIGKSTIIKKILAELEGVAPGGYFTLGKGRDIFMFPASGRAEDGFAVGQRGSCGFTQVFNEKGTQILKDSEAAELIVLDEVGWMERDAAVFSEEILKLLSSGKCVLGVIRKDCDTALCNAIRKAPGVKIIEVSEQNRSALASELSGLFTEHFSK